MFFILSKTLHILLNPIVLLLLLMLRLFFIPVHSRKFKWLLKLIFVLVLVFSNPWIINTLLKKWEEPQIKLMADQQYASIIILGGISTYDFQFNRVQFNQNADRLFQALPLFHKKVAPILLLSGGSGFISDTAQVESVFLKNYLSSIGINKKTILIDSLSRNTYENAQYSMNILKEHQLKEQKHLLITSAYHMRRAKACFKKQGIKVDTYATNQFTDATMSFQAMVTPSIQAVMKWNILIHELIGYAMYKILDYT